MILTYTDSNYYFNLIEMGMNTHICTSSKEYLTKLLEYTYIGHQNKKRSITDSIYPWGWHKK